MKKIISKKLLIAILIPAILCISCLVAFLIYYNTPEPLVPLTAEQEIQLIQQHIASFYPPDKRTIDDFTVKRYFGTYNNCIVALIDLNGGGTIPVVVDEIIAGCRFIYSERTTLFVYRDGDVVPLKEAYERDWLSFKDIKDIHHYYMG